jgi:hypothetical protein
MIMAIMLVIMIMVTSSTTITTYTNLLVCGILPAAKVVVDREENKIITHCSVLFDNSFLFILGSSIRFQYTNTNTRIR